MAYYVPLGPRGLLLRAGTSLIKVIHAAIYWQSSRRRRLAVNLVSAAVVLPDDAEVGPVA